MLLDLKNIKPDLELKSLARLYPTLLKYRSQSSADKIVFKTFEKLLPLIILFKIDHVLFGTIITIFQIFYKIIYRILGE